MEAPAKAERFAGIQSLVRAFRLIEEIAVHREGIGLAKLSRTVDLHNSTAFHLTKTLATLGYVRQDEATKRYRIGPMVFRLASSAFDESEMVSTALPILQLLVTRTGATGQLAICTDGDAVVVASADSGGPFRIAKNLGIARPIHATAIGKVLLSALTPADLDLLLDRLDMPPLTDRTITDRRRLASEIAAVRASGFALEEGEFHPEIFCIAAPVRNFSGSIVAALGISAPTWRSAEGDQAIKVVALLQAGEALSAIWGYVAPEAASSLASVAHAELAASAKRSHIDAAPGKHVGHEARVGGQSS
jgi:IclR family transcriptional regulator, KDG regulon repressor